MENHDKENRYDVIILGSGENGRNTVEILNQQGKKALFIDLEPEMLHTLMSQKSNLSSSTHDQQTEYQLCFETHHLKTPIHETTTYHFQTQPIPIQNQVETVDEVEVENTTIEETSIEETSIEEEIIGKESIQEEQHWNEPIVVNEVPEDEFISNKESSMTETEFNQAEQESEETFSEEQVLEAEPYTPANKEKSLREKIRQQAKRLYQDSILSEHFFEPVDNDQTTTNKVETHQVNFNDSILQSTQPIYFERALRLRKKMVSHNWTEDELSHQETEESLDNKTTGKLLPVVTLRENEEKDPSEILNLENFTPRRRSRAQKKQRLFQKMDHIKEEQNEKEESGTPKSSPLKFASLLQNTLISDIEPNSEKETYEPVHESESENQSDPNLEKNTDELDTSPLSHMLKTDTIEFEDPYGDYSSWEDVFPNYDQNNRKREEMDKVEKRKIALRGLHNLINNLG